MSATELARSVVSALAADGVREVVLAPGSRNAPLAFAAYDAAEAGLLRLHTRIDERTAGFLALGLTKGGSRAAVVCTSGTAVANLHPAVLEAFHARVPLVVVTADRPLRLRGTDANQTTDQLGIFGPQVSTVDVADAVASIGPGLVDPQRPARRPAGARRPIGPRRGLHRNCDPQTTICCTVPQTRSSAPARSSLPVTMPDLVPGAWRP